MGREHKSLGRPGPAFVIGAVLLFAVSAERYPSARQALPSMDDAAMRGLARVFARGETLQDTNGDELPDRVNARIVLNPSPSAAEIAAAANIAARFGFETSAMDLPLAIRTGESIPAGITLLVSVGRTANVQRLVDAGELDLTRLRTGEGLIVYAPSRDSRNTPDQLIVVGADDERTAAVAAAFASRAPYLWNLGGTTFEKLEEDLRTFLSQAGTPADSIWVRSVTVDRSGQDFAAVEVKGEFPSASAVARAQATLQSLARNHQKRAQADVLSYPGAAVIEAFLSAENATARRIQIPRAAGVAPVNVGSARPPRGGKRMDLTNLYGVDGLLGDSQNDLIPDGLDTIIVPADGEEALGAVNLAARLTLESTGVNFPVAKHASAISNAESEPQLILIGRTNPLTEKLTNERKFESGDLQPGQGLIRIVPSAFGQSAAVVVTGADSRGVRRATEQLAERLPYVWHRGKDRPTVSNIVEESRLLFSGRSPAGQAAHALYQIQRLAKEIEGKDIEAATVNVYVEHAPEGFADFVKADVARQFKADSLDASVAGIDIHHEVPVFTEDIDIPSEVDDLKALIRTKVIPAIVAGKRNKRSVGPVQIEARLSEPPELRRTLERSFRDELIKAGATDPDVRILSAYKQGYSWLTEVVAPAVKGKARTIIIRFAELGPPQGAKPQSTAPVDVSRWQAMYSPIRWLQELYPVDEIIARDLNLPIEAITFEQAPIGAPIYDVEVRDANGTSIFRSTFDPKFVYRPYFDQFPNYETVRVTTGWVKATVGGLVVADERVVTDIEKFWDHWQAKTLPRIYAYVMELFDGKPDPDDAPYFGQLTVDLTLSEPNYRIGLDEEQISSLDSVHDEVFFPTMHFFDLMGRYTAGRGLSFPGRIIPLMHPKSDGQPGRAKISFTGKAANKPKVTLLYRETGKVPVRRELSIPKIRIVRPEASAVWVKDGTDGIERLEISIAADFAEDSRAELIRRSAEQQVDGRILFAPQALAVVDNLRRLQAKALYSDALTYERLREIAFRLRWPGGERTEILVASDASTPPKNLRDLAPNYKYDGERIVQWDTVISPTEAYTMLAKMATFPEVTPYWVGRSFLGKDIWAADVLPPITATHWSQAKASVLKPTIIYSARQHAAEPSSTSHVLRLLELLVTDERYRKYLMRVNVIIHPITNPDGAQLAYELQKLNPYFAQHASYLGSLGVDMTSGAGEEDPLYPEANVRPKLWRTWLPDAFLNPHGYSSHEWVQVFSEYAAWVRTREPQGRDWWGMRGWYTTINYAEGQKDIALGLREYIVEGINSDPAVRAMNERGYARYRRYGYTFAPDTYKLNIYKGVNVYMPPKGDAGDGGGAVGPNLRSYYQKLTYITMGTEAPDQTGQGEWMQTVASAGLQWDLAILRFLYDSSFRIERRQTAIADGVWLALFRARPGIPPKVTGQSSGPNPN